MTEISPDPVRLREIESSDLPTLYDFQLDLDSCLMAATKPRTREVFDAHWECALDSTDIVANAILTGNTFCGCVSCFETQGQHAIGYWLGKPFWGRGIATRALELFLADVLIRPLHASVATTNVASLRVLQKCGFKIVGQRTSPETDRYIACDETLLELVGDSEGDMPF